MDAIFLNPVIISIILLCVMCICKVNVLLSIIASAIIAGLISGMPVETIMHTFIGGMGGNSETALSYILLGTFAAAMTDTGVTGMLGSIISKYVKENKYILLLIITLIAMASQNIIPIHIAFIPILIPPLLGIMNRLQIDRRAVACALAFGLKTPYITIPIGFGLIFQNLIKSSMADNGFEVTSSQVWQSNIILGFGMVCGLLISIFISYRKPRQYKASDSEIKLQSDEKFGKKQIIIIAAIVATFVVQLIFKSLPLGALVGLGIIFSLGAVKHHKMDNILNEGVYLMGFIAFVMLVASGFSEVLKATGGIDSFINTVIPILPADKFVMSCLLLLTGLFVTIGIGTSFGTIPILAVLFVPIFTKLGFSAPEAIIVLSAAAALGDAGSPASDTTLGPTAGLNADGQHNHIYDTCIPTFIHYNIPLIIFALIGIMIFYFLYKYCKKNRTIGSCTNYLNFAIFKK